MMQYGTNLRKTKLWQMLKRRSFCVCRKTKKPNKRPVLALRGEEDRAARGVDKE
jgi:hypothetical protein